MPHPFDFFLSNGWEAENMSIGVALPTVLRSRREQWKIAQDKSAAADAVLGTLPTHIHSPVGATESAQKNSRESPVLPTRVCLYAAKNLHVGGVQKCTN